MFQEVLALLVVAVALGYLFYSIFRIIKPAKGREQTLCGGCSANGCEAKSLKKV